jgi:hypothetical protein
MKMAYFGSHSSKQHSLLVHLLNSALGFPGYTLDILYDPSLKFSSVTQVRISKYDAKMQFNKEVKNNHVHVLQLFLREYSPSCCQNITRAVNMHASPISISLTSFITIYIIFIVGSVMKTILPLLSR